jgi:pimeloyl-ACP methyl ester carboxylesterase
MVRPLRDVESAQFPEILEQAFERTDPPASVVPTPAIPTYLGLESSKQFDTLVISPPSNRVASDAALIFLHGYAGNFYIYCWELAQAAASANLVTYCPSTGSSGAWWEPEGELTLRATLEYARRSGMNRIYLAGLSNGAAGASVLALSHRSELSGLVLISGTRATQPAALPTLVVQGQSDQMMPAASARAYAARNPQAQYHELAGGHLILLSRYQQVRPLIGSFLLGLEQRAPGSPLFAGKPKR